MMFSWQNNQHRAQWPTRCKDSSPQRAASSCADDTSPEFSTQNHFWLCLQEERSSLRARSPRLSLPNCNDKQRQGCLPLCPVQSSTHWGYHNIPPFTLTNSLAWLAGLRKTCLPVYLRGQYRDHSIGQGRKWGQPLLRTLSDQLSRSSLNSSFWALMEASKHGRT